MAGRTALRGLLVALVLHGGVGAAPDLTGELSAGVWTSNRLLDNRGSLGVVRARAALDWQLEDGLAVVAEAWVASGPETMDGRRSAAGLREAYLQARTLPCQPALGQRVVAWGKTDAITPTDQISPTNYRRLVAKDSEQRSGVWGLHLNCAAGPGRLQVHWLGRFRFNAVPLPAPPGVRIAEETPRLRPTLALRYDVLSSAADWSLGAIDGHDLFPTLALRAVSAQGVQLVTTATRTRLLGGDIALTRGALVLRAEAAWVEPVQGSMAAAAQRRPYVQAVAGVEASFAERETLALQVFGKQLRGAAPASADPLQAQLQSAQGLLSNEGDRRQAGFTLRYARPLWAQRGDIDLFTLWAYPQREWLLRGRLGFELDAAWRLGAGFEIFRGPAASFLGHLRPNSLAFAEIRYAW